MTKDFRNRIVLETRRHVCQYSEAYLSRGITARKVASFYIKTSVYLESAGWDEEKIFKKISQSVGNYMLIFKHGLTPAQYAKSCIEYDEFTKR